MLAVMAAPTDRRTFLRYLAMLAVGARTLLQSGDVRAAAYAAGTKPAWPAMTYRPLGRTGWRASRLVFGCGASLSRGPKDALLDAAFDAGINVYDVGFRGYYADAEKNLGGFARKHRDGIFLISKAMVPLEVAPDAAPTVAQAKAAAARWSELLDGSLGELGVEQVDAYYLMASNNPAFIRSDEVGNAFAAAKQAGKTRFVGLSTHQSAEAVLDAAAGTGWYDLAMIAITPAGWYDWTGKRILPGTKPMVELEPVLARARAAGIGLVGMKAGRILGAGAPDVFDRYYGEALRRADLSPFQRSYAFVLEHGLDVVNADVQTFAQLEENVTAAATSARYVA